MAAPIAVDGPTANGAGQRRDAAVEASPGQHFEFGAGRGAGGAAAAAAADRSVLLLQRLQHLRVHRLETFQLPPDRSEIGIRFVFRAVSISRWLNR